MDSIIFGSLDDAVITKPEPGQSICRHSISPWGDRIYYLDNSPTIGQYNDDVDATGTVEGIVTDTLLTAE